MHYFLEMPYAAVLDSYPRVRAWLEELFSRPAVRKVVSLMAKEFR
jgi:glutathione S-transferase